MYFKQSTTYMTTRASRNIPVQRRFVFEKRFADNAISLAQFPLLDMPSQVTTGTRRQRCDSLLHSMSTREERREGQIVSFEISDG